MYGRPAVPAMVTLLKSLYLHRGVARGGERSEISPLSPFLRVHFRSELTSRYYNLSLSTSNENKQFSCLRRPMPGPKGPILGLREPFQAQEGSSKGRKGPSESEIYEKLLVFMGGRPRPEGPFHG